MIIRRLEALFSFKYDPEKLNKAIISLDIFAKKAHLAIGAIAGSAALIGLKNFMNTTAATADHIGKTSSKLGISVEALQEFHFAAEQSGVTTNTFDMALQRFSRRAAEAAKSTGKARAAFKKLDITVTDSTGKLRDPINMMNEVADSLAGIKDQGERIRLSVKFFDTGGVDMIKMMQGGSHEMEKLRQEARDLGFVLDKKATDSAANYNDAMNRLNRACKGLSDVMFIKLMPAYTAMANFSAKLVAGFNSAESSTSVLRVALLALSGVLTAIAIKIMIAFSPVILIVSAIGAAIILVALLIDDLWVAFKGGDSVLGALYKKAKEFFGSMKQWLLNLSKVVWQSITKAFDDSVTYITNQLTKLEKWVIDIIASLETQVASFFNNLKPSFLADGFSATLKLLGLQQPSNTKAPDFVPQPISHLNQVKQQHNQNISVAVNVKNGANPHEIGGEVSKAIRRELQKERINTAMGVMSYAN